jgi:SsrA-binding protein
LPGSRLSPAAMAEPRTVTVNRKARHDYFIEETVEAGLILTGSEVKSLRDGRANLKDSFARVDRGEAFLVNAHISPYDAAARDGHEPTRSRKLLLHRREIDRLSGKVKEKGLTVIPLRLYFNARGRAKVELGLARGKRQYDKRQAIKEREARRETERALRSGRRGGR